MAKFQISTVDSLPEIKRVLRGSKYDAVIAQVPDAGFLFLEFETVKAARNAQSTLRAYLKRRELTEAYNLERRDKSIYISKGEAS